MASLPRMLRARGAVGAIAAAALALLAASSSVVAAADEFGRATVSWHSDASCKKVGSIVTVNANICNAVSGGAAARGAVLCGVGEASGRQREDSTREAPCRN